MISTRILAYRELENLELTGRFWGELMECSLKQGHLPPRMTFETVQVIREEEQKCKQWQNGLTAREKCFLLGAFGLIGALVGGAFMFGCAILEALWHR